MEKFDFSTMSNLELIQRYVFFCMMRNDAASDRGAPRGNPRLVDVTRRMCEAEGEIVRRMTVGYPEG